MNILTYYITFALDSCIAYQTSSTVLADPVNTQNDSFFTSKDLKETIEVATDPALWEVNEELINAVLKKDLRQDL